LDGLRESGREGRGERGGFTASRVSHRTQFAGTKEADGRRRPTKLGGESGFVIHMEVRGVKREEKERIVVFSRQGVRNLSLYPGAEMGKQLRKFVPLFWEGGSDAT